MGPHIHLASSAVVIGAHRRRQPSCRQINGGQAAQSWQSPPTACSIDSGHRPSDLRPVHGPESLWRSGSRTQQGCDHVDPHRRRDWLQPLLCLRLATLLHLPQFHGQPLDPQRHPAFASRDPHHGGPSRRRWRRRHGWWRSRRSPWPTPNQIERRV